jgi:hypothetical protein
VLWDFGDTLVDERWLYRPPTGWPSWTEDWADVMRVHADGWNDGTVSRADIFTAMAQQSGIPSDEVERHARRCCTHLEPYETAWRIAAERHRPQAIVTVNPDLFGDWIVPAYDLSTTFDTIVISAVERTVDKTALCTIALERLGHRLGYTPDRADALLIDNRLDLVEDWRAAGGSAYWFRSDAQFAADVTDLLE